MKIASKERIAGRTHRIAGKDYTFIPEPNTNGPSVCDVTDEAAIAVFLDQRNSNLFYALDPKVAPPKRPGAPAGKGGKGNAPNTDAADAAALLLSNDEQVVLGLIDQVNDAGVLAELQKQESARGEGARESILKKLATKAG